MKRKFWKPRKTRRGRQAEATHKARKAWHLASEARRKTAWRRPASRIVRRPRVPDLTGGMALAAVMGEGMGGLDLLLRDQPHDLMTIRIREELHDPGRRSAQSALPNPEEGRT